MAARSRDDQIGFLFPCDFRNGLSRSSHTHPRDPESHAKSFPLQILNLLTDCGLNIGLIDNHAHWRRPCPSSRSDGGSPGLSTW